MSGYSFWAIRGSQRYRALLAAGWEESDSRVWKLVHGEFVSVLMVFGLSASWKILPLYADTGILRAPGGAEDVGFL